MKTSLEEVKYSERHLQQSHLVQAKEHLNMKNGVF
jgi:hypothetical protein